MALLSHPLPERAISRRCTPDRPLGQVCLKLKGSSVTPTRDDMDESNLLVVSFVENPVVLEGKADEVGRIIMICFANSRETCNQSANCHEIVSAITSRSRREGLAGARYRWRSVG